MFEALQARESKRDGETVGGARTLDKNYKAICTVTLLKFCETSVSWGK